MNMNIKIEVDDDSPPLQGEAGRGLIAPLLLIPFVENSFKHGASKMLAHPWIELRVTIENNMLHFFIMNSKPPEAEPLLKKGNIGLKNVKKRLQLLYPGSHELSIVSKPESFEVDLKIRLQKRMQLSPVTEEIKTKTAYAME